MILSSLRSDFDKNVFHGLREMENHFSDLREIFWESVGRVKNFVGKMKKKSGKPKLTKIIKKKR